MKGFVIIWLLIFNLVIYIHMKSKSLLSFIGPATGVVLLLFSCSSQKKTSVPCPKLDPSRYRSHSSVQQKKAVLRAFRSDRTDRSFHRYYAPVEKIGQNTAEGTHKETVLAEPLVIAATYPFPAVEEPAGLILRSGERRIAPTSASYASYASFAAREEKCDTLVFRNGDRQVVHVREISQFTVRYNRCENPDGPVYTVSTGELFMIKYPNGTRDFFSEATPEIRQSEVLTPQVEGLGLAGFISSLTGLFVFGIPLGFLAVIFGSVSMGKHRRNPGKFKGRGLAMAAVIIGLVDIIGVLILLSAIK